MPKISARPLGWPQVLLLAVPCVAVLVVPFFNRIEPQLWGIPFFYWWQLLWVPLSGVFIALAYKMVIVKRPGDER